MVKLTFKQRVKIDTQRGYVATLEADIPYLLTNYHAGHSIEPEYCSEMAPFDAYQAYEGGALNTGSLLILWLAGLGDTIAFAPALTSIQNHNPGATIDVLTIPALAEVLESAGFNGRPTNYPAALATVNQYDYFLPLEQVGEDPDFFQIDGIDFWAKQLHQPSSLIPADLLIEESVREEMQLPSTPLIRVGIQVKGLSPLRTYPADLLAVVLRELVRNGCEVHLLGQADDCKAPPAPPLLYNHCGRTQSFHKTAALVEQMDVMICPDSYLMHLSGALGVATVAIFSTMPARLRTSRYHSIVALEPDAHCSPCLAVEDASCPLGHDECIALRSPNVSPEVLIKTVMALAIGQQATHSGG